MLSTSASSATTDDPVVLRRPHRWVTWLQPASAVVLMGFFAWVWRTSPAPDPSTCTDRCTDGGGSWVFPVLVVAVFVLMSLVGTLDAYRSKVTLAADGLERERLGRRSRIPWERIVGAALVDDRTGKARPQVTLVLADGQVVTLRELGVPRFPPFGRPAPARESVKAVELINHRVGRESAIPAPPAPATRPVMTLSRGFVSAALVIIFVPLLVAAIILVTLPFTRSTATVDPAQVPAGRPYTGFVAPDGSTHYYVDCPPPLGSADGGDVLCRSHGRSSLRVAEIGAPIALVGLVLIVVAFVANRRRPKRRFDVLPSTGTPLAEPGGRMVGLDLDALAEPVQQVVQVVRRSLSPSRQATSSLAAAWDRDGRRIVIEVRSATPDTAVVRLAPDRGGVRVQLASTRFRVDPSPDHRGPWAELGDVLGATFDGRFVEAGGRTNRFGRVELRSGRVLSVGAPHLPLPWSWRRRHRWAAY